MPAGVVNKVTSLSAAELTALGMAADFQWQLFAKNNQLVTAWSGGESRQLAIAPVGSTLLARDFRWRLSSATVLQDGAFSDFTGFQRLLSLWTGTGLVLQVDAHQMTLADSSYVARFAGAAKASGYLTAGPVQDLNLIAADGIASGLQRCDLLAASSHFVAGAQRLWLVFSDQACTVRWQQHELVLQSGDVLVLHGDFSLSASTPDTTAPDTPMPPVVWLGWLQA